MVIVARRRTSPQNWQKPRKWNAQAEAFHATHGRRQRVFCASLADVFDNAVDPAWRSDLWALIRECDQLDWLLLTKRPQNMAKMLPPDWNDGWPNVWLGTSAGTQKTADQNIPHLLKTPAAIRFVSAEPMLGPIQMEKFLRPGCGICPPWEQPCRMACPHMDRGLDWVICGGESGTNARPMHPTWAKSLRDQCENAGKAFLFKQWGEWTDNITMGIDGEVQLRALHQIQRGEIHRVHTFDDNVQMFRLGKKYAGRDLDGREWNETPNGN